MLKIWLLLSVLTLCDSVPAPFNNTNAELKKIDYCKLHCKEKEYGLHSACFCKRRSDRREYLHNMTGFRHYMQKKHNYLRNLVASGNEKRQNMKSATNMMLLNYDLQLEYSARCFARFRFKGEHDYCKPRVGGTFVGQNLAGNTLYPFDDKYTIEEMHIVSWYEEIEFLPKHPGILEKLYANSEFEKIGHFTQLLWYSTDLVGCARSYTPKAWKIYLIKTAYVFTSICNYASTFDPDGPNYPGRPTYIPGEPCTKCPNNFKCETKEFPALCGPEYPVPTEPPFPFDAGNIITGKFFLLVITFLILLI